MKIKIKFKTPVQIANVDGSRQNLKPGTYELDEQVINHWFIKGLISSGSAVLIEKQKLVDKLKGPSIVNTIVNPEESLTEEEPSETLGETILENVEIEEPPKEEKLKKASRRRRSE